MKFFLKILSVLLLSSLFYSCSVGLSLQYDFTYLNADRKKQFDEKEKELLATKQKAIITKEQINAVLLYFEGEKIDFEYEKIGLIGVTGNMYSDDNELILEIKRLAVSRGCNAILNLKKDFVQRESGFIFQDTPREKYNTFTYYGIAIFKKIE